MILDLILIRNLCLNLIKNENWKYNPLILISNKISKSKEIFIIETNMYSLMLTLSSVSSLQKVVLLKLLTVFQRLQNEILNRWLPSWFLSPSWVLWIEVYREYRYIVQGISDLLI